MPPDGYFVYVVNDARVTTNHYFAALHDGASYAWRVISCGSLITSCADSSFYYFSTPVGGWGIPIIPTQPNSGSPAAPGPTTGDKNVTLNRLGSSDVEYYTVVIQNQRA